MIAQQKFSPLVSVLKERPNIIFAALVGSRALGVERDESDWDIALWWRSDMDWLAMLGETETLRHDLAAALGVEASAVDLIELRRANLAMRASVAEEGIPMKGDDTLEWARFLQRTWRELEDFYWDKAHAA